MKNPYESNQRFESACCGSEVIRGLCDECKEPSGIVRFEDAEPYPQSGSPPSVGEIAAVTFVVVALVVFGFGLDVIERMQ